MMRRTRPTVALAVLAGTLLAGALAPAAALRAQELDASDTAATGAASPRELLERLAGAAAAGEQEALVKLYDRSDAEARAWAEVHATLLDLAAAAADFETSLVRAYGPDAVKALPMPAGQRGPAALLDHVQAAAATAQINQDGDRAVTQGFGRNAREELHMVRRDGRWYADPGAGVPGDRQRMRGLVQRALPMLREGTQGLRNLTEEVGQPGVTVEQIQQKMAAQIAAFRDRAHNGAAPPDGGGASGGGRAVDARHAAALRQGRSTPLHAAAQKGELARVRSLLEEGADPNANDEVGDTPLHKAIFRGGADVVRLLLQGGADPNDLNNALKTPLHEAAFYGKDQLVQLLLDRGAELEAAGPLDQTPLYFAALSGERSTVDLLLSRGASVTGRAGGKSQPMEGATAGGHVPIAELLLSQGAPLAAPPGGQTLLHHAAGGGHAAMVIWLIRGGAEVQARTATGETPLHRAAALPGGSAAARLLIEQGAQVNTATGPQASHTHKGLTIRGYTPLHLAALTGAAETVQRLLEHGADVHAQEQAGKTPLALALAAGHADIAEVLRRRGASE